MKIRPIRSEVELKAVLECAKTDGHSLVFPSQVVEKDNYIIGAVSIIPMALVWMDTKRAKVRDTLQVNDFIEGLLAQSGRVLCVPCTSDSPLIGVMPKLGYVNVGESNLFVKGI